MTTDVAGGHSGQGTAKGKPTVSCCAVDWYDTSGRSVDLYVQVEHPLLEENVLRQNSRPQTHMTGGTHVLRGSVCTFRHALLVVDEKTRKTDWL